MILPTTRSRVPAHTSADVNRQIRAATRQRLDYFARHPERIAERLQELDEEWDIERALEANAATLALAGTVLGLLMDRRWLLLPMAVTGFLLQHAVQGWCPPVPVLRRLGFRTPREIDNERIAIKALRGDFQQLAGGPDAGHDALAAAER